MNLSDTDQALYSAPAPQTATVSDEAVQVAIDAYSRQMDYNDDDDDALKAAIIAVIPHLTAALSPAEPVDQWQDISTAPKNGGFLAANSKEVWAAWHYDSANWHAKYGSRGATHWMPLPSAPTSKGGE